MPSASQAIVPGARVVSLPGLGHLAHEEDAGRTAALIVEAAQAGAGLMTAWIASGRVLDLILLGMALEAAALVALWRASAAGWRRGPAAQPASGMCLLLAMRAGLGGAWWGWVSLPLLGALLLHGMDLRRRWRTAPP